MDILSDPTTPLMKSNSLSVSFPYSTKGSSTPQEACLEKMFQESDSCFSILETNPFAFSIILLLEITQSLWAFILS